MCDMMSCRMHADVSDRFPYTCCLRRSVGQRPQKKQYHNGSTVAPCLVLNSQDSQPWADSTSLYLLAGGKYAVRRSAISSRACMHD
jgi:hypothetical protein